MKNENGSRLLDKKKNGIIITILVVLLLLVVGVTYAFFTYESGTKSDIVTGQIYMNYEETSTISLTGVFPETKEQALSRNDENGVFEFTITGRNTSKYPVYYEIDLLEGGVMTGKTEQSTKILPEHVRIYLERDGEPLVDGMTYKDWNNRRIYVDTVPAGTTSNIEHKYTLRMWIDENVTISDTDSNADYTTEEWNDAYASLKVRVVGDFEEKVIETDASCFAYNVISYDITYDYLTELTLDTSEEKVNTCKEFLLNDYFGGNDNSDAQDGYQSFCEGTGIVMEMTLKEVIAGGFFTDEEIQSLGVVESYEFETRYYRLNTSEESVNSCKEYMLDWEGGDYSDAGDGYQSFCEGTGTMWNEFGDIFIVSVDEGITYNLIELNVFTQVETPRGEIEITNYDESCGTDVVIPTYIEGLPVTRIADSGRDSGFLNGGEISSVKFPNTLKYIGAGSCNGNKLTKVIIPDSVTEIGTSAFRGNNITNIEIGNGIKIIGEQAFYGNPLVTVNIRSNPSLSYDSFLSDGNDTFETFQYGGTCAELKQYRGVFGSSSDGLPKTIITTDGNSCDYSEGIK